MSPHPRDILQTLAAWRQDEVIAALDLGFGQFLLRLAPKASTLLPLAGALLAHLEQAGHTCLDLPEFLHRPGRYLDWPKETLITLEQCLATWPRQEDWHQALKHDHPAVGLANAPGSDTPLVLDGSRLYLRRYWRDEIFIAEALSNRAQTRSAYCSNAQQLVPLLECLFPESTSSPAGCNDIPWQKVACAIALRQRFSIITGGPGTGKTWTAARLIALLLQDAPQQRRIVLAAPTGKAAVRIDESLRHAVSQLPALPQLPDPARAFARVGSARTLHSLLGSRPGERGFRHHSANPLDLDILIVDEASMIHQEMMAALLRALPDHASLILLGDQDQLASVEAGSVLGELCAQSAGFDGDSCTWLGHSCGVQLDPSASLSNPLASTVVRLQRSHRFDQDIAALADAVHAGDTHATQSCLTKDTPNLVWHADGGTQGPLDLALTEQGYGAYLRLLRQRPTRAEHTAWVQQLLQRFAQFRLLCALRKGPWGVEGLNAALEQALAQNQLLQSQQHWYLGRPVLVTRNDSELRLSNGDIGLSLGNPDGQLRVYFPGSDDSVRAFLPSRLNDVESAWAMTVHKSQGSEFAHTALVFPPYDNPVVSRELFYTAVTRARQQFTLFATPHSLETALQRPTQRMSGLAARLPSK